MLGCEGRTAPLGESQGEPGNAALPLPTSSMLSSAGGSAAWTEA